MSHKIPTQESEQITRQVYKAFNQSGITKKDSQTQINTMIQRIADEHQVDILLVSSHWRWYNDFMFKGGDLDMFVSGKAPRDKCFTKPTPATERAPRTNPTPGKADDRSRNNARMELASAIFLVNSKLESDQQRFDERLQLLAAEMQGKTGPALQSVLNKMHALEQSRLNLGKERDKFLAMLPFDGESLVGQKVSLLKICQTLGVDFDLALRNVMYRNLAGFITEEQREKVAQAEAAEAEHEKEERLRLKRLDDNLPAHLRDGKVTKNW